MTGHSEHDSLEATLPAEGGNDEPDDQSAGLTRGEEIGPYLLISQAGTGATGLVFAAYDPRLDRKIALKLLKPHGGGLDRARKRLQREAQALAKLDHPNVVAVHDVGVHHGQLFVAMEFVEGQTLGAWMDSAPAISTAPKLRPDGGHETPLKLRPWREVLDVFTQAGRGLAAAHKAGLVHRDFKPDNVMLSEGGRVRVMDFGLARDGDRSYDGELIESTHASTHATARTSSLTQTGGLLGTPAYMSFEQFSARQPDARSDQFSFCVALYEALYGERPFVGETMGELVAALQEGIVREPMQRTRVPGWVRVVVLRGLEREPGDRFESMQALLDALAADPVARRRRLVTRTGVGLGLAASLWGVVTLSSKLDSSEAVIQKQESELEKTNAALNRQLAKQTRLLDEQTRLLSVQRGLRASNLVGTGYEAEALLLGVQAVGTYASAWGDAPPEATEGLGQVLAYDRVILEASDVLVGHQDYVVHVAYSPDGTLLATASLDGSARLWDPERARVRAVLDHRGAKVVSLAFAPDGERLATASLDGKARLWSVATGELLTTLVGHEAAVTTVKFSPDGTQLATAGDEKEVRLWDARTGALRASLVADDKGPVHDLEYSPDGTRLVTGGNDGEARVWDPKTGQRLTTLTGHEDRLLTLAISPDGRRVATGGDDMTTRVWALETGEPLATLDGHNRLIANLAFSPDGTRLTTASWDKTGRVYNPETGTLVAALEGGHSYGVVGLAYAPDGASIATSSFDGGVALWDAETGKLKAQLRGHSRDVWSLAFAPDGHQLTTASVDHSARLWDLGATKVARREGPEANVNWFSYSADGTILATRSGGGLVRVWTSDTGELRHAIDDKLGSKANVAYSRDGRQLAVVDQGQLRFWDAQTGALRSTADLSDLEPGGHLQFSPRGSLLAYVTSNSRRDGALSIFDTRTHERLGTIEHQQLRTRTVFSPDDAHIAVFSDAPTVVLRDSRTGTPVATFDIPGDRVLEARLSPDGAELMINSAEVGIQLWDIRSVTPRLTLPDSRGYRAVIYAPSGARLVGAGQSEGLRIWDAKTGEVLVTTTPEDTFPDIMRVRLSPDESLVAALGSGILRIHESETGRLVTSIEGRRALITRFDFWGDQRLTTMSTGQTIEVWNPRTGEPLMEEQIGIVRDDGSVDAPIPPRELTRIGCERLQVFRRAYDKAETICAPLLGR